MSNPDDIPCLEPLHVSVLQAEVLELLDPQPGETFIDATLGVGGHARLILERLGPSGRLIGLDQDPEMLAFADRRLAGLPATLRHRNFEDLSAVLEELQLGQVDGILADLGFARTKWLTPSVDSVSSARGRSTCA